LREKSIIAGSEFYRAYFYPIFSRAKSSQTDEIEAAASENCRKWQKWACQQDYASKAEFTLFRATHFGPRSESA
jgi:hypothetical protein